jgi:hypothetical protein
MFTVPCRSPPRIVARTIAYPIRFLPFRAATSALAGRSWQEPRHVRLGMVLAVRRVVQEQSRTLFIFFGPASSSRLPGDGGGPVRSSGTVPSSQTVARTFAYLIQLFFREIARLSIQQPGGTQYQGCCEVWYGSTPRPGLCCRSGRSRAFPTRSWRVNSSRYRFDRCFPRLRSFRTSSALLAT